MATLTALFGGAYLGFSGPSKKTITPPINASTPDEADFIKYARPFPPRLCSGPYRKRGPRVLTSLQEVPRDQRSRRQVETLSGDGWRA